MFDKTLKASRVIRNQELRKGVQYNPLFSRPKDVKEKPEPKD